MRIYPNKLFYLCNCIFGLVSAQLAAIWAYPCLSQQQQFSFFFFLCFFFLAKSMHISSFELILNALAISNDFPFLLLFFLFWTTKQWSYCCVWMFVESQNLRIDLFWLLPGCGCRNAILLSASNMNLPKRKRHLVSFTVASSKLFSHT